MRDMEYLRDVRVLGVVNVTWPLIIFARHGLGV